MKKASIKELKNNLAHFTDIAAKGDTILVSKYNKPYIVISSAYSQNIIMGKKTGKNLRKSSLREASNNTYLEYLMEDRG